jgi:hypothetical protein
VRHPSFTAVYDACVLHPAPLHHFLIRLGLSGRFGARWSTQIHDEWKRNLLLNRTDLTADQLNRSPLSWIWPFRMLSLPATKNCSPDSPQLSGNVNTSNTLL